MKMFILECTEEELKANRGIMDAIVDACSGVINTFWGTMQPVHCDDLEEEDETDGTEE